MARPAADGAAGRPLVWVHAARTARYGVRAAAWYGRAGLAPKLSFGICFIYCVFAEFGPLILPVSPTQLTGGQPFQGPVVGTGSGSTSFGRSVFSQVVVGARSAVIAAVLAVGVSAVVGTLLGVVGGYLGGFIDGGLVSMARSFARRVVHWGTLGPWCRAWSACHPGHRCRPPVA